MKGWLNNKPRLFELIRYSDKKGLSGIGKVLVGVVFPDGRVVVQWQSDTTSIGIFRNLRDFEKIHTKPFYAGQSEFRWSEGFRPADEVLIVLDELENFARTYSSGKIGNKTRGDFVAKIHAIKATHRSQQKFEERAPTPLE